MHCWVLASAFLWRRWACFCRRFSFFFHVFHFFRSLLPRRRAWMAVAAFAASAASASSVDFVRARHPRTMAWMAVAAWFFFRAWFLRAYK